MSRACSLTCFTFSSLRFGIFSYSAEVRLFIGAIFLDIFKRRKSARAKDLININRYATLLFVRSVGTAVGVKYGERILDEEPENLVRSFPRWFRYGGAIHEASPPRCTKPTIRRSET